MTLCCQPSTDDPAEFHDFKSLYKELTSFQTYRKGATRRVAASQCTGKWLATNGTFRPLLVTPDNHSFIGKEKEGEEDFLALVAQRPTVPTLDVKHQLPGPHWTGEQWVDYWKRRCGEAGDGGSISNTACQTLLAAPALIMNSLPHATSRPACINDVDVLSYAPCDTFIGYFPFKACTKFSLPPVGAAVWLRIVRGSVKVVLIPPTQDNLSSYAANLTASPQEQTEFLPKLCQGTALVELSAEEGGILMVPPGWLIAVATIADAILLGGHFYRADSLSLHVDCWQLQERIVASSFSANSMLSAQRLGGLFTNPEDGGMLQMRQAIHDIAATYAKKVYSIVAHRVGIDPQRLGATINSRREKLLERFSSFKQSLEPGIKSRSDIVHVKGKEQKQPGKSQGNKRRRVSRIDLDFIVSDDDDDRVKVKGEVEEEWKPRKRDVTSESGSDLSDESYDERAGLRRQTSRRVRLSKSREDEGSLRKSTRIRQRSHKYDASFRFDQEENQFIQNPPLVTKIKLGRVAQPGIPQLDGADDFTQVLNEGIVDSVTLNVLSKQEQQGLVGLVAGVLTWYKSWDAGQRADIAASIATLEVSLKALLGESMFCLEEGKDSGQCQNNAEKLCVGNEELGDETSPAQLKIQQTASSQSPTNKGSSKGHQMAVQKSVIRSDMKKLSTKDRLKRKLGL